MKSGSKGSFLVGAVMLALGLLLLSGVGGYRLYAYYARSQLDRLNYTAEPPSPRYDALRSAPSYDTEDPTPAPNVDGPSASPEPPPEDRSASQGGPSDGEEGQATAPSVGEYPFAALFPGLGIHPKYWGHPLTAGADPYVPGDPGLPEGFRPVTASDVLPRGSGSVALRIRIPAIGVDSAVQELAIVDLGDSRAYETPKNVVGHIPETVNPGEAGNGWFFGHLESPIKGEGNVFFRLPEIPGLLRDGETVDVFLETEEAEYLYRVVSTKVVYQDDLRLTDASEPVITLVACVPRLVYDHRLLVTARLIGLRE